MTYPNYLSAAEIEREQSAYITKVYSWMSFALLLTGFTAMYVAGSPSLTQLFLGNKLVFFGLLLAELGLVVWLSAAVAGMSANTASMAFVGYAVLNGVTFSSIFMRYTSSSIASTFLITAGTFAAMSAYGYFTKRDLTKMGNLLFMALIGLVVTSLVNIFLQSSTIHWITSAAGVLIFTGLIAYDTQKIKDMNVIGNEGTEEDRKEAIMGALALYLDFINLFLHLLRFLGDRKN